MDERDSDRSCALQHGNDEHGIVVVLESGWLGRDGVRAGCILGGGAVVVYKFVRLQDRSARPTVEGT